MGKALARYKFKIIKELKYRGRQWRMASEPNTQALGKPESHAGKEN